MLGIVFTSGKGAFNRLKPEAAPTQDVRLQLGVDEHVEAEELVAAVVGVDLQNVSQTEGETYMVMEPLQEMVIDAENGLDHNILHWQCNDQRNGRFCTNLLSISSQCQSLCLGDASTRKKGSIYCPCNKIGKENYASNLH